MDAFLFIGWELDRDRRSVGDAAEERWWDDAEDRGKGCEWEREDEEWIKVNWVRNIRACVGTSKPLVISDHKEERPEYRDQSEVCVTRFDSPYSRLSNLPQPHP